MKIKIVHTVNRRDVVATYEPIDLALISWLGAKEEPGPNCDAEIPDPGENPWHCTREPGHKGPHLVSLGGYIYATYPANGKECQKLKVKRTRETF